MTTAGALIGLVGEIIALGVLSRALGDRFHVPSIVFEGAFHLRVGREAATETGVVRRRPSVRRIGDWAWPH